NYIKRPENAFVLFRRKCCEDRVLSSSAPSSTFDGPISVDSPSLATNATAPGKVKKQRQADLSKTISQQWKALPSEERAKWEALAKEKKTEHEALHPGYVYRPQRTSNKNRVHASASSSSHAQQRRKQSAPPKQIEFIVPAPRIPHGRSSSVPTPPPHQAIQVPNVYVPAGPSSYSQDGSADESTNLFTRFGVGTGNGTWGVGLGEGEGGGFDYMPTYGAFDFEANLQSSDFLRAMFPQLTPAGTENNGLLPAASISSSPYSTPSTSFHPSAFTTSIPPSAS
ncbi:hypothetical protein R3P38DRAFT_3601056, partial [Favolaschia claudopus]